jgi:hypothetical protein
MRNITRTALAASGIAAAAALTAYGAASVGKTPPASLPSVFTPAAEPAAAASSPAQSSPDTTGPLGTSFTVTTENDQGQPVSYTVTLVKVDQHAALAPYASVQDAGDHIAAARFSITGVSGQESDDANNDASATGTDTTGYPSTVNEVTDGPNFSYGQFTVSAGQTESGWVMFELPAGVTVASVSWQPGMDGPAATWNLGA